MSYTYLLEQGEESSAASFSDIPPYVLSRLNLTAGKSCSKGSGTESCQSSPSGTMSPPSTELRGEERSMSSQGVFLVKTSQAPGGGLELKANEADSGQKWPESLAKYDRNSRSWRTAQCLLFEDLGESLETFPNWGMMRDGECWEQTMLEEITLEKGYGFWPTPVASECRDTWAKPKSLARLYKGDRVARFLCKSWLESNLEMPERVALNPCWQEERMMWPIGQSDLKPLATDKFQSWQHSHSEFLEGSSNEVA